MSPVKRVQFIRYALYCRNRGLVESHLTTLQQFLRETYGVTKGNGKQIAYEEIYI